MVQPMFTRNKSISEEEEVEERRMRRRRRIRRKQEEEGEEADEGEAEVMKKRKGHNTRLHSLKTQIFLSYPVGRRGYLSGSALASDSPRLPGNDQHDLRTHRFRRCCQQGDKRA